jgi:hypothetical protein
LEPGEVQGSFAGSESPVKWLKKGLKAANMSFFERFQRTELPSCALKSWLGFQKFLRQVFVKDCRRSL